MEALDTFQTKLDALLKKYAATEAENKRLRETLEANSKAMDILQKKLAAMDNDMVSVHLGTSVSGDEEKDNMRRQLDTVIAEIDKILNTLND